MQLTGWWGHISDISRNWFGYNEHPQPRRSSKLCGETTALSAETLVKSLPLDTSCIIRDLFSSTYFCSIFLTYLLLQPKRNKLFMNHYHRLIIEQCWEQYFELWQMVRAQGFQYYYVSKHATYILEGRKQIRNQTCKVKHFTQLYTYNQLLLVVKVW